MRRDRRDHGIDARVHLAHRREPRDPLGWGRGRGIGRHGAIIMACRAKVRVRNGGGRRHMAERSIDLRGLKCPLPALRTRKALRGMAVDDVLVVECTDPLAAIDIPNLINQTGDLLETASRAEQVLTFRIRKR
jgi:tRNA 2-thiouridine synthesizing protein A